MELVTPNSRLEFDEYYLFRWQFLRKPWNQPLGSEKDDLEDYAYHKMVILNNQIVGVGRLHFEKDVGVVRYMATHPDFSGLGIGSKILKELETIASRKHYKKIKLNARESAVKFYEKNGYSLIEKTHLLFGEIQHYLMTKDL